MIAISMIVGLLIGICFTVCTLQKELDAMPKRVSYDEIFEAIFEHLDKEGRIWVDEATEEVYNLLYDKKIKKYYYLIDSDGGEHEFYGTYKDAKAEALERGYDIDAIVEEDED